MTAHRLKQRRASQKKRAKSTSLNLVSLMDIFTILVFFLMVNSSEVEVLQSNSKIKLPDSTSEKRPENRLVISIDANDVIVQGRAVATVADVENTKAPMIAGLTEELRYQAQRKGAVPEGGHEITIMGDREIPYWLLKKIMLTCQATEFAKISLAVNKLETGDEDVGDTSTADGVAAASSPRESGGTS